MECTVQDELIIVGPGLLQEPNHPYPEPGRGACRGAQGRPK